MEGLSDSNLNTEKEGGGEVCPIVTPGERNERKQNRRGMACEEPIFIQTCNKKCTTSFQINKRS